MKSKTNFRSFQTKQKAKLKVMTVTIKMILQKHEFQGNQ